VNVPVIRVVGDVLCVVVCFLAAVSDIRTKRIPDYLTLTALALGLLLSVSGGGYSFAGAVMAVVLLGGLFTLFAAAGGLGWGDVKLAAAVGALLGWPLGAWSIVLYVLFFTTVIGGVLGLVIAVRRGRLGTTLKAAFRLPRRSSGDSEPQPSGVYLPYAVAIGLGCCWAVLGRYLPAVLLV